MILSESDCLIYAPSVEQTGEILLGSILQVQAIIESKIGRSLEMTEYTEKKSLNRELQNTYLSYFPIVNPPVPTVKIRSGNTLTRSRQGVPISDWQELTEDEYTLDSDGLINLNMESIHQNYLSYFYGYNEYKFNKISTEIEVTYSAGVNFTLNTSEVKMLKAAAGAILAYIDSPNFKGVSSLEVPFREFKISYSSSSPATVPDSLFLPFMKYKPVVL